MNHWNKKTIREQLDKRLESLEEFSASAMPKQGWIRTLREALGLSSAQLGKKAGVDQSRISRMETAEKDGNIRLASLQKIAAGLKMKFVYGFVPKESLERIVEEQAGRMASAVRDLLERARPNADRQPVHVGHVLARIAEAMRSQGFFHKH